MCVTFVVLCIYNSYTSFIAVYSDEFLAEIFDELDAALLKERIEQVIEKFIAILKMLIIISIFLSIYFCIKYFSYSLKRHVP